MTFEVKTLQYGQPRKYADSIYKYEITSDLGDIETELKCTTEVYKCSKKYKEEWYDDFYSFVKINDTTYIYTVTSPYLD